MNTQVQELGQNIRSGAKQSHNYEHITMGASSDIENVNVAQLRAFYTRYDQPDDAVLIVAGKFDPEHTLQAIAAKFLKIPRPDRALPPEHTVEPVQDGEREVTLRRHGGSPFIGAMFHLPQAASPQYIPLRLGVANLAHTPSGRLYHPLVETRLCTGESGYTMGLRQPGGRTSVGQGKEV